MFSGLFAGCSGVLGIEDFHTAMIRGTLRDIGPDAPVAANVVIAWYRGPDATHGDATRLGETTTAHDGDFELSVTAEPPLESYLEIVDPRYVHTFSRVIQPVLVHADTYVDILTATADGLQALAGHAGETQGAQRWLVIAQVVDADGGTRPGVTVDAEVADPRGPVAQICYSDETNDLPCRAGGTGSDGRAWLFDVPATSSLSITAIDRDGSHATSFPITAGPGVVFTPVPPSS